MITATQPHTPQLATTGTRPVILRDIGARAVECGLTGQFIVLVKDFPGLDAELSIADARGIAAQLLRAADAAEQVQS